MRLSNFSITFKHLGFALLLPTAFILSGCEEKVEEQIEVTPRVKFEEVFPDDSQRIRNLSGQVQAAETSVLSFPINGRVIEMAAELGDRVEAGQMMAMMDPTNYQLAKDKASAQVRTQKAKLVEAQEEYVRKETLYKKDLVAKAALDTAKAALDTSLSEVDVAISELKRAERDLEKTVILAPFSGEVSVKSVETFTEVSIGQSIYELEAEGAMNVEVLVPESMIQKLDYGHPAIVRFPGARGLEIPAIVSEIASQSESGNAFLVKLSLQKPEEAPTGEGRLFSGMTATVSFLLDSETSGPVYTIPISAISLQSLSEANEAQNERSSLAPVFVYDQATETVKRVFVTIGKTRGNRLEVYSGLNAGDKIIVAGVSFLHDGMSALLWQPE
ncbi:efflux RND transporter periplasmic adaptor subunit [Curvivirga sp.]|uniref:efflux RND transporter periplasmic adaptor subunit n=1 Tax=Curvivirga sp. TaxID=2856848 RepID=UPI003B5AFA3A